MDVFLLWWGLNMTTMLLPTYDCVKSAEIQADNLRRREEKLLLLRDLKNFDT